MKTFLLFLLIGFKGYAFDIVEVGLDHEINNNVCSEAKELINDKYLKYDCDMSLSSREFSENGDIKKTGIIFVPFKIHRTDFPSYLRCKVTYEAIKLDSSYSLNPAGISVKDTDKTLFEHTAKLGSCGAYKQYSDRSEQIDLERVLKAESNLEVTWSDLSEDVSNESIAEINDSPKRTLKKKFLNRVENIKEVLNTAIIK